MAPGRLIGRRRKSADAGPLTRCTLYGLETSTPLVPEASLSRERFATVARLLADRRPALRPTLGDEPPGSIGQMGAKVDWVPRGRHGSNGGQRPARSAGHDAGCACVME